jgi:signal transduction histidine kinase
MSAPGHRIRPLDHTLRWVVVGWRLASLVWMAALVGATLSTDTEANRYVVAGALALAVVWTLVTLFGAYQPWLHSYRWLAADGIVALAISVAPFVANSHDLFFGGYPLSWVLMAAYVGNLSPALVSAALLGAGQVIGATGREGYTATRSVGDIAVFLAAALAFGWGLKALRDNDRLRSEAIHALEEEQAARMRAHDRAEIAAHLHDSVLQTLALVQQNSADQKRVASLARGQERELRAWIDKISSPFTNSFGASLRRVGGEVEDLYQVKVQAVTVGDCEMTERLEALIEAAREALVNAAKHAGIDTVSLYSEVSDGSVTITVRDRGRGFSTDSTTTEGRGMAESITGRMQRHGGSANIRSAPGEGTEVELTIGVGDGET